MKYINFRFDITNTVALELACSHGDCTQKLKGDENFCPKCGSKLKKLPGYLDKEAIIALINENIDKLPKPLKMEGRKIVNADCSTTGGGCEAEGRTVNSEPEVKPVCPYGKGFPEVCGHCTGKGACNFTVLTSMPPKYNMCPFRGSGYIDCSEAE